MGVNWCTAHVVTEAPAPLGIMCPPYFTTQMYGSIYTICNIDISYTLSYTIQNALNHNLCLPLELMWRAIRISLLKVKTCTMRNQRVKVTLG